MKTRSGLRLIKISLLICLFFLVTTKLVQAAGSDVNGDGQVNWQDALQVMRRWGTKGSGLVEDISNDLAVNGFDLGFIARDWGKTVATPTAGPTLPPAQPSEWTQFGHDAQRTNFTSQTVATPWRLKWQWNASNPDGEKQASHLSVPKGVQPITGGGRIYLAVKDGSSEQLYSFDKNDGRIIWQQSGLGRVVTTPAYDNGNLYVTSSNGVYRLDAATKAIKNSMTNLGAFKMSPLLVSDKNRLYVANDSGVLYAIDLNSWQTVWSYHGGAPAATPPSYSPSTGLVIYATHDLYVHAVRESTGLSGWEGKKKPTSRSPFDGVYGSDSYWPNPDGSPSSSTASFEYAWPAIAEGHGIFFIRARLNWDTAMGSAFPSSNAGIKDYLENNSNLQALFALKLADGTPAFGTEVNGSPIPPAVGNGGEGDGGELQMGPMPVIALVPKPTPSEGFDEVAYIIWRNGLTCAGDYCDGREDATMGEMVLGNGISGYSAGDVRFVKYEDIQTDEMMNLTMSGTTLFHSHWLIAAAHKITNRAYSLGGSFSNPIQTSAAPFFVWRQCQGGGCNPPLYPCLVCPDCLGCYGNCSSSSSHYCSGGLYSYGDSRGYPTGFYEYFEDDDNIDEVNWPDEPFTVVSDGLVIVLARDGGLMVLENGSSAENSEPSLKLVENKENSAVLGTKTPQALTSYQEADKYVGKQVTVKGKIESAQNLRPKAVYLGFKNPHKGALLVRIFEKDLAKFSYDPLDLEGHQIEVTGLVTIYSPGAGDPEIVVTDPGQIKIIN